MSMALSKPLETIMQELPEEDRDIVEHLVKRLWEKRDQKAEPPKPRPLGFSWVGALKDLREKYTSVELQHKIRDMWADNVFDGLEHPAGASSGKRKGR